MALLGGQFKSATHGQFKSAQGGHFDRILHCGLFESGISNKVPSIGRPIKKPFGHSRQLNFITVR